jgi:hypothetical protein
VPAHDAEGGDPDCGRPGRYHQGIATSLRLSAGTVRSYLSRAIAQTGPSNRVDAIRIAAESGWLQPSPGPLTWDARAPEPQARPHALAVGRSGEMREANPAGIIGKCK